MDRTRGGLIFAVLLLAAACEGTAPSSPSEPTGSTDESASAIASTAQSPSVEASPEPSAEPSTSAEPSGDASQDPATGPAAGCTGSDENKTFYAAVAEAVEWTVYCPVLPAGWFVTTGSYSGAGGGVMEIGYKGPRGQTLALHEGHLCADGPDACAPRDSVIGPAAFGDQEGELGSVAGGLVIHVDRGTEPMWEVTGTGLDEQTFRSYGEALIPVAG